MGLRLVIVVLRVRVFAVTVFRSECWRFLRLRQRRLQTDRVSSFCRLLIRGVSTVDLLSHNNHACCMLVLVYCFLVCTDSVRNGCHQIGLYLVVIALRVLVFVSHKFVTVFFFVSSVGKRTASSVQCRLRLACSFVEFSQSSCSQ